MAKLKTIGSRLATMEPTKLDVIDTSNSWRRGKESSTKRGYGYKWQKARERFLIANPLCIYCQKTGTIKPANVVDHIVPHRGDMKLFWDQSNWQALCSSCHSAVKQKEEQNN